MNAPVIIIGAPRSGTNILRDVLTSLPGYATWPCDEINLMWRHGNRDYPSDELIASQATPKVQWYMREQFAKLGRKHSARVVVEKTCANSLRVDYVDACIPDARYLFITRDGVDAAVSAIQRWNAPFDLKYTAAKVKFVPPGDLPYYGFRFVQNRLKSHQANATSEGSVSSWWGPKLDGQQTLQAEHPLDELCMLQWKRCVDKSADSLARIPDDRVHHLSYESFVSDPRTHVSGILDFLGERGPVPDSAIASVSPKSVGKGRSALGPESVARLEEIAPETLARFGYV